MSARCWTRRRRNKYMRPFLRYVARHPDRALVFNTMMLTKESIIIGKAVDYVPLGNYKHASVYRMMEVNDA